MGKYVKINKSKISRAFKESRLYRVKASLLLTGLYYYRNKHRGEFVWAGKNPL